MDQQSKKDTKKQEILFRPITEGLGFHPFTDGLPYAPVAKSSRSSPSSPNSSAQIHQAPPAFGAGAVAAGPPQMAPRMGTQATMPQIARSQSIPRISVPVANSPIFHGNLEARHGIQTGSSFESDRISPIPQKLVQPPEFSPVHGLDYVVRRFVAYSIDTLLNTMLFFSILVGFLVRQDSNLDVLANVGVILLTVGVWAGFHWALTMLQEVVFKTTLGKRILGLSLKGSSLRLFFRSLLFIPSIVFFGIGILWSLFDRQKRCWHDHAVGVQPIELNRWS